MPLLDLMSEECICLALRSTDKHSVLPELVDILHGAGKLSDRQAFLQAIQDREASGSTGLQYGIAIPHARSGAVGEAAIAFAIAREGIDFDALDGEPSVFFVLVAESEEVDSEHLEILATVCRHLKEEKFCQALLQADSVAKVLALFEAAERGAPLPEPTSETNHLVAAVTSCPVGISHTYLAAECLRDAARRMGIQLRVETHGSVGVKGELSAEEIARAQAVILAVDRKLDTGRFAGKPVVESWVTEAIRHPEELLRKALSESGQEEAPSPEANDGIPQAESRHLADLYRHLMNGVSGILPFLMAGGIAVSLARLLGLDTESTGLGGWLLALGGTQGAFGLLAPVMAGFIGRSIAQWPGFMPAMVGGLVLGQAGAGLIGGMVAGLMGGYGMLAIRFSLRGLPDEFEVIRSIVLYPLLGLLCCSGVSLLLASPLVALHQGISAWLFRLDWQGEALLGALLGALMVVDMGGPINKIAYTFGIIAIGMGRYLPPAAVMAAGMVPPLAMGMATLVFRSRFDAAERRLGRACLFKGICFVTEGIIPFAARSPGRVIVPCVIGAMVSGALSMVFGCGLMIPHGGVFVIPLVAHWLWYCVAIASGVLLSMILVGLLKKAPPTGQQGEL